MFLLHKLFSILFAHKKDVTAVAFFFIFLEKIRQIESEVLR